MADKNNIYSDNNPDSALALDYGQVLSGERAESEIRDPLFALLMSAKNEQLLQERQVEVLGQGDVWARLQADMETSEPAEKKSAIIHKLKAGQTWFRVAAAILLIALTSLITFFLTRPADPVLLASAGNAIEIVTLNDGSNVTLRPNSSIYEVSFSERMQAYRLDGEALFNVASIPSREFSVQAGQGMVTVLGTRFNLFERNNQSRVDLIEGSVQFKNTQTGELTVLQPGQAALISDAVSLSGPFTSETEEVTGWSQNRLTFRNRNLQEILRELEFHYNIRIDAPEQIQTEALGGSITLESADQSLRDLGTVLGGEFVETDPDRFEFRTY